MQIRSQTANAALGAWGRYLVHLIEHILHATCFIAAEVTLTLPRAHQLSLAALRNTDAL